jgi:hypothetical protein
VQVYFELVLRRPIESTRQIGHYFRFARHPPAIDRQGFQQGQRRAETAGQISSGVTHRDRRKMPAAALRLSAILWTPDLFSLIGSYLQE